MSELRDEVREHVSHIRREINNLSLDAPDFPLQWAKIVGMVIFVNQMQVGYNPTTGSGTSATTTPQLKCPSCGVMHTLTLT